MSEEKNKKVKVGTQVKETSQSQPQPQTSISTPSNMETHAHHLHRAPGKKIWHYFYEFLMLFLAIFCGFLAENFREHKVDQERGRQYIHSFREDLAKDTLECSVSINELTEVRSRLNGMSACFNIINENPKATGCLKEIILNAFGFKDFIYTDRTIQQLKNAGGLRLIEDKEIADSIIAYDATVREMQIHQGVLENQQQNAIDAHNNMIDFLNLENLIQNQRADTLLLLSTDRSQLNKYFNIVSSFKRGLIGQLRWMQTIKDEAKRLLGVLDKKGYR